MSEQRYIVASSPRTGSYLLCEGLEATGIAGRPTEVFSPHFQNLWRERWAVEQTVGFAPYLRAALAYGTTSNGVYGVKIHWMHLDQLARDAKFSGNSADVLAHLFPEARFIHIVRRDRRAQAISYFRALATNEWWRIEGLPNDQIRGSDPRLDVAAVLQLETALAGHERAWIAFFAERNIVPLTIQYEELADDYRGELARALDFLGVDVSAAQRVPEPRLVVQADDVTQHWRCMTDSAAAECARAQ